VIFYAIYKNQEITFTIGVHLLQWGPWKESGCCNVAPGAAGWRGWANSGELAVARGRGRTGEWSRDALGPIWGFGPGGGGSGEQLAGGQGGAAAVGAVPARLRPMCGNRQWWLL
jgi:hypothetical protein